MEINAKVVEDGGCAAEPGEAVTSQIEILQANDAKERLQITEGIVVEVQSADIGCSDAEV